MSLKAVCGRKSKSDLLVEYVSWAAYNIFVFIGCDVYFMTDLFVSPNFDIRMGRSSEAPGYKFCKNFRSDPVSVY